MQFIRPIFTVILAAFFLTGTARAAEPQKVQKMKDVLVSPDLVDFKLIKVGKAGAQIMTIMNKGNAAVTLKSVKKIKAPFSVEGKFPRSLAPGKSTDVKIIFKRQKPEEYKGPVKLIVSPQGDLMLVVSR